MAALYAYYRLTDDIADGNGEPATKRTALHKWRAMLRDALAGCYSHPCHAALHQTVVRYGIPREDLEGVIDGSEKDIGECQFSTFEDLHGYCFDVASTVGRACVCVWGAADLPAALKLAGPAGVAFQLTNVLRDLGEDLDRGRVYLPCDEWTQFACPPAAWRDRPESFQKMMKFQVERARDYYRQAEPLHEVLSSDGRAIYRVIAGLYRRLLDEIERRDYDVFAERVRVSKWAKVRLMASAWPAKWGWL